MSDLAMKLAVVSVCLSVFVCLTGAAPQGGGGYPKQPDGFFQYVNVPGQKEYEFGWNRGNDHHYISRYEQAKEHRFRTRVKWGDAKGGYGEHYYEYNHGPESYVPEEKPYQHEPSYEPAYEPPSYKPPTYQ